MMVRLVADADLESAGAEAGTLQGNGRLLRQPGFGEIENHRRITAVVAARIVEIIATNKSQHARGFYNISLLGRIAIGLFEMSHTARKTDERASLDVMREPTVDLIIEIDARSLE